MGAAADSDLVRIGVLHADGLVQGIHTIRHIIGARVARQALHAVLAEPWQEGQGARRELAAPTSPDGGLSTMSSWQCIVKALLSIDCWCCLGIKKQWYTFSCAHDFNYHNHALDLRYISNFDLPPPHPWARCENYIGIIIHQNTSQIPHVSSDALLQNNLCVSGPRNLNKWYRISITQQ